MARKAAKKVGTGKKKQGRGEPRTSKRILTAKVKQARALKMRLDGHLLQDIAAELGYASESGVVRALDSAITNMAREPAERLRDIEIARLERYHRDLMAILEQAIKDEQPAQVLQTMDRLVKLAQRRAKLMGLDAPDEHRIQATIAPEVRAIMDASPAEVEDQAVAAFKSNPDLWERVKARVEG